MSVKEKAAVKLSVLNEKVSALLSQQQSIEIEISESKSEISKIKQFLEMYDDLSTDENLTGTFTLNTLNQQIAKYHNDNVAQKHDEPVVFLKIHEIIELVSDYLRDNAPQSSDSLVGYLEHSGRSIKGADKSTYISAILSKSDKFVARRKYGGWFLAEQDPEPHKDELPTTSIAGNSIL